VKRLFFHKFGLKSTGEMEYVVGFLVRAWAQMNLIARIAAVWPWRNTIEMRRKR
jgi:hypothetical protein